jgi:hypothetical protein
VDIKIDTGGVDEDIVQMLMAGHRHHPGAARQPLL